MVLHKGSHLSHQHSIRLCGELRVSQGRRFLWLATYSEIKVFLCSVPLIHYSVFMFFTSCLAVAMFFPHLLSCARFFSVPFCHIFPRPLEQARPRFGWVLLPLSSSDSVPDSPLGPSSGQSSSLNQKASALVGIFTMGSVKHK